MPNLFNIFRHLKTPKRYKHKVACIGDSLTQGFQNGCVYRTDLSFPALLAQCFEDNKFHAPVFTEKGGLPINLELLIRYLRNYVGKNITWRDYIPAATELYYHMRAAKKHWERLDYALPGNHKMPFHNQAFWGCAISDTWLLNYQNSTEYMRNHPPANSIFNAMPGNSMYQTARLTLNPGLLERASQNTVLDNIAELDEDGGIENLIVYVGSNNAIGAVTKLRFRYSEADELETLPEQRNFTVSRPEHFKRDFEKLARKVDRFSSKRVITATLPYPTIPPVTLGISSQKQNNNASRYYDYYTHYWIWEDEFNPDVHRHITKEEAIELDKVIDAYNEIIEDVAKYYGWIVVPINRYVYDLHYGIERRDTPSKTYPDELSQALARNPLTQHLLTPDGQPALNTNYVEVDSETNKLVNGGIFSLDGMHPTTISYGLIAHYFRTSMRKDGVRFDKDLDWDYIVENDSLVSTPPLLLNNLRHVMRILSMDRNTTTPTWTNHLLFQLMDLFGYRRG